MATFLKREGPRGTRWQAKIRRTGEPMLTKTSALKRDAQAWAAEVERDLRLGRLVTQEAERRTLAQLITRYEADVLDRRGGDAEKRRQQLEWWRERIGRYRLAAVTPALVAEQRDLLPRERGLTPGTVNRYLAALSHAFSVAVREWGWLDVNPVRNVSRLTEPRGRVRYLDEDERARLLTACKPTPDLYALVVLALSTGARRGDLMALRWPDVDLDRRRLIFQQTKNGERRAVPIFGPALALMADRGKVRRLDTDRVFPGTRDPDRPRFPRHAWERALATAELEDFRFHDLRHSAASYLAMGGASTVELAAVLGHKTLQMVKRYSHLSDDHTAGVVERMNARIFGDADLA